MSQFTNTFKTSFHKSCTLKIGIFYNSVTFLSKVLKHLKKYEYGMAWHGLI